MDLKQTPDGGLEIYSDQEGKGLAKFGGPKSSVGGLSATVQWRGATVAHVTLAGVASATALTAGIANFQLSATDDVVIDNVQVLIAQTTPACTIDVGTSTTAATRGATAGNLLDSIVSTSVAFQDTQTSKGTNGKTSTYLAAGGYIHVSPQAITCGTLTGDLWVTFHKA